MPDARTLVLFLTPLFFPACVYWPESRSWYRDGRRHSAQPIYWRNPRDLNRDYQDYRYPGYPWPRHHPAWDGMGRPHEFYRGRR